ncbi:MAG: hypothetical protein JST04_16840 [Bdellovibrionales bacterium]|nr:hypothetical protein [Bdellovibrionales bacterium]
MRLAILILLAAASSSVRANEVVYRNAPFDGLPVCVETDSHTFLVRWIADENYRREVFVRALSGEVCRDYASSGWHRSATAFRLFGYREWSAAESPFTAAVNAELGWIERGANRRPPVDNGGDYGREHPDYRYTFDENRVLAGAYGKQWSTEVFGGEILERYQSPARLARVHAWKDHFLAHPDEIDRGGRAKWSILVTLGFGWGNPDDPSIPAFEHEILEDLKKLGYPVVFLRTDTFGLIQDNVKALVPQLDRLFSVDPARKWIALSLSRGSPDLWSALSAARRWDRVGGWIGLSSMNGSSYLCELTRRWNFPLIRERWAKGRNALKAVRFAQSICPSQMRKLVEEALPEIPTRTPWFEVVGIPSHFDLPESDDDLMGKLFRVSRYLKASIGAHDGLVEYPGQIFPKAIEDRVVIPTTGTHTLADGEWESLPLDRSLNRRVLFRSLVETAIEASPLTAAR